MNRSKGSIEAELSKAITQWEKDFLGRGSLSVKSDLLRDMIIVNLRGVLTPAEYVVSESKEGMYSIKRMRTELVESGVDDLKNIVNSITGQEVISFHTDISTKSGERVMVFKLGSNYEKIFL
ncbi:DUF2294 domain-containing protein [Bacillus weihaiensis]|uniref:Na+-translocating membrane potential-generating system MpsC domain-containing protein n=1 Tax=Bacillus weihaiensis TaxID=1547283 RepID=A0A1L3MS65_9BACI|nr:DUF2294 domain-containing protein [Bacillus weihaiensis]APH05160.1 hypothetical protein A9C19_10595 [Bacillus weihaiensis]